MKIIRKFRPLSVCQEYVLWARGFSIFISDHRAEKFEWVGDLPVGITRTLCTKIRIIQRLGRLEVYSATCIAKDIFLLATRGQIWYLNVKARRIELDHSLRVGSRPLSLLCLKDSPLYSDGVYFGEYWSNPKREGVGIYHRDSEGVWKCLFSFPPGSIDHVHSLLEDPKTREIWILTGDFDGGSGFWVADSGFKNVRPVLVGSQDYRATWASWQGNHLFYATDSQTVRNSFRYLHKDDQRWSTSVLGSTYGSSVYFAKTKNWIAFSTVVEPVVSNAKSLLSLVDTTPGPGILGRNSYVYLRRDTDSLEVLLGLEKDWLPPALFQFGTIIFPEYLIDESSTLYAYCVALQDRDACTVLLDV